MALKGSLGGGRRMLGRLRRALRRTATPLSRGPAPLMTHYDSAYGASRGTPVDRALMGEFLRERGNRALNMSQRPIVLEFGGTAAAETYLKNASKCASIEFREAEYLHWDNRTGQMAGDLRTGVADSAIHTVHCVVATQVLFTQRDPLKALRSVRDLLAPGGVVIGTEPFLEPVSNYDRARWGDWWRFTPAGLGSLLNEAGFCGIEIVPLGNEKLAAAQILGMACEDLPREWIRSPASDSAPVLTAYVARQSEGSHL